jgi:hypothetical protein
MFTKEDDLLLDFLYGYKIIFNYIQVESMKYQINDTLDNIIPHFTKVKIIENETKKEDLYHMIPIGDVIGNTFYWLHPNVKALFEDTTEAFIKSFKFNKTLTNTMLKFFKNEKIEFTEKFRESIPFFISVMYPLNKANVVKFRKQKENEYIYYFIQIPLDIPKLLVDQIIIELQRLEKDKKEIYYPKRIINNIK